MNIADLLGEQHALRPDAPAVIRGGETVGYAALDDWVWRTAAALRDRGVTPGEVVATHFVDELHGLVATLALARVGASVFTLAVSDPALAREREAASVGAARLLTDDAGAHAAGLAPCVVDLDAIRSGTAPVDASVRADAPAAPWLILTGSGSTGRPKRMHLHHRTTFERNAVQRDAMPIAPGERVLCMASVEFGLTKQRYVEAIAFGATVVMYDRATEGPLAVCRAHSVDVLHASVFHVESLLARVPADRVRVLEGLRVLRIGSSFVSDSLKQRAMRTLTPNVYVIYALNELGIASVARPEDFTPGRTRPGSVGRPPSLIELQVVDAQGEPVPDGTVGLIRVRGPGLVDGYAGDPEASASAFRGGWFYPGDLGVRSPQGDLVFSGRADQMMILDGINIYPAEIENALMSHPAVRDAAAFPLASELHHQVPVCVVVLDDAAGVDANSLRQWARERLGARAPRRVIRVAEIPRNESGKLQRAELARVLGAASGG
ncbi:MAG: class I adenylate-forming enzyme family protein [Burkholderiaceae bacterium]